MRRLLITAALTAFMAVFAGGTAYGHGSLDIAAPGPGARVPAGVDRIEIQFKGALAQSAPQQVELLDSRNKNWISDDPKFSGNTMTASVKPLEAGLHKVRYTVKLDDGHQATGSYYFSVLPRPADNSGVSTTLYIAGGATIAAIPLLITAGLLRRRFRKS
jgi:methionine-rich copper-binding protein CopC